MKTKLTLVSSGIPGTKTLRSAFVQVPCDHNGKAKIDPVNKMKVLNRPLKHVS